MSAATPSAIRDTVNLPYRRAPYGVLIILLFAVYIVGAHLRLSIYSGQSIILPMYLMLLSAGALALIFFAPLVRAVGWPFGALAVFVLLQPALSFAPQSVSVDTLLAGLQLVASVAAALAVIYALSRVERPRLRRVLIWIWATVILLAILENIGLKPLFDELRKVIYAGSGRFLYFAEVRDLQIYGRVRSTVLASEPSFLADTLMSLALMIFFLDPRRGALWSWGRLGVMLAASFLVAPSFKMAFYVIAVLVWQFWPRTPRDLLVLAGGLIVGATLLAVLSEPLWTAFFSVAGRHLESGSFYGRIGVAPDVGWRVLTTYPLMGYGIGNESGLYPLVSGAWGDSGALSRFPWFAYLPATDLMTNGFWWGVSFLGVLGSAVFWTTIWLALRSLGVDAPLRSTICASIVWYAGAAFVDPHSWYMLVVFSIGSVAPQLVRTSRVQPRPLDVTLTCSRKTGPV